MTDGAENASDKELSGLLKRLEQLVDPRGAVQAVGDRFEPAWRRVTKEEPLLWVGIVSAFAIALMVLLPTRVANRPLWVLPVLAAIFLIAVLVSKSVKFERRTVVLRLVSVLLIAAIGFGNAVSDARLIADLVRGVGIREPGELLRAGAMIWFTNVIVFALLYWQFDRGGPVERSAGTHQFPDFLFPQMASPEFVRPDWEPGFIDYLYLSFTNATAFSPTDVMPMTRWTKLTMLAQSAISVVTIALVIARAVNILQ